MENKLRELKIPTFSTKMKYSMIIEEGENNYSAYLPDLPGCVATAKTIEELKHLMHEAVELHIKGMIEDGLPIRNQIAMSSM